MTAILWQLAGWTMIHFLWIGTLVLLATAIVRGALRGARPRASYGATLVGFALLALMPVAIGLVLAQEVDWNAAAERQIVPTPVAEPADAERVRPPATIDLAETPLVLDAPPAGAMPVGSEAVGSEEVLVGETERSRAGVPMAAAEEAALEWPSRDWQWMGRVPGYLPWVWLVGTPVMLVLLAFGLVGSGRLKRQAEILSAGPVHGALERIRVAMGVRRRVLLAVSERVVGPVLVGILRPMILLPPAALTGWSPEEIEMALVHELAHVRRWDNLVNVLQRVVEAVLFFHPAVWMVSRWLREGREHCCDAMVVAHTGRREAYAELLVSVAQQSVHRRLPSAAVALSSHPLARRVRRILQLEDEAMVVSKRMMVLVGVVLVGLVATTLWMGTANSAADEAVQEPEASAGGEAGTAEGAEELNTETTEGAEGIGAHSAEFSGASKTYNFSADTPYKEVQRVIAVHEKAGQRVSIVSSARGPAKIVVTKEPPSYRGDTESSDAKSPFLPLEEQRIADLAYGMFQVEVAPAKEELVRVAKEKGFAGGMEVTGGEVNWQGGLRQGDILVGLHVWPTADFDELGEVLRRDDLFEFNPLKYHVVRPPGKPDGKPELVSGRVSFNGTAWEQEQQRLEREQTAGDADDPFAAAPGTDPFGGGASEAAGDNPFGAPSDGEQQQVPNEVRPPAPADANLLYDGRTFEDWRNEWRNELKVENRTEAIKALRAFGRAGYGKEATEAILEVADQYPMTSIGAENTPQQQLQTAIAYSFVDINDSTPIAAEITLPVILDWYEGEKQNRERLTVWVLARTTSQEESLQQEIADIGHAEMEWLGSAALVHLIHSDPHLERATTRSLLASSLQAAKKEVVVSALQSLVDSRVVVDRDDGNLFKHVVELRALPPELPPLLFHNDLTVRQWARWAVNHATPEQIKDLPRRLMDVVEQPTKQASFDGLSLVESADEAGKQERQFNALRGLAAIGPEAQGVTSRLLRLMANAQDDVRAMAEFAIKGLYRTDAPPGQIPGDVEEKISQAVKKKPLGKVNLDIGQEYENLFPSRAARGEGSFGVGGFGREQGGGGVF